MCLHAWFVRLSVHFGMDRIFVFGVLECCYGNTDFDFEREPNLCCDFPALDDYGVVFLWVFFSLISLMLFCFLFHLVPLISSSCCFVFLAVYCCLLNFICITVVVKPEI